jgi:hypothetical protein
MDHLEELQNRSKREVTVEVLQILVTSAVGSIENRPNTPRQRWRTAGKSKTRVNRDSNAKLKPKQLSDARQLTLAVVADADLIDLSS